MPYNLKLIKNEMDICEKALGSICRLVLRNEIWCRLVSGLDFYIHFGWDYYMYVGNNVCSEEAISFGRAQNLFIEEMMSPNIPSEED